MKLLQAGACSIRPIRAWSARGACSIRPMACSIRPMACSIRPMACSIRPIFGRFFRFISLIRLISPTGPALEGRAGLQSKSARAALPRSRFTRSGTLAPARRRLAFAALSRRLDNRSWQT